MSSTPEPPPVPPKPRPRRRWWSLSVRGLMLLVLVVGGAIGWEVNRVARIRRAVAVIVRNPGDPPGERPATDALDFLALGQPDRNMVTFATVKSAWLPDWVRDAVGDEHLPRLAIVRFARAPSPADWEAVAALGPLFSISVGYIDLNGEDLAGLRSCSSPFDLSLINTKLTDKAIPSVGTLRKLQKLDLRMTEVTPAGLAPLANLTDLRELELSDVAGTDTGLQHLQGLTKLTKLDASGFGSELSDVGLSCLRGMTQLEELTFEALQVTDAGIATLTRFPRLRELKVRAVFFRNKEAIKLSPPGVALLGQLNHLDSLELTLSSAIDDTWLAAIGRLVGLKHLHIDGNAITDAGLVHLEGLTQLTDLHLSSDQLTDDGLAHLKGLTTLTELRIVSPHVTGAGLDHLRPLTKLTNLSFYAKVSDEAIAAIRPVFPALKFVYNTQRPDPSDTGLLKIDAPGLLAPAPPSPFKVQRGPSKLASPPPPVSPP